MPKPTNNVLTLRRLLQQQLALGQRMVALAEEETEALIQGDVPHLNRTQDELQKCLEQQMMFEKARIAVVRDLGWALGMERIPTFSELLPVLPVREQEALSQLRAQLLEVQARLDLLNRRNRQLLEVALDCTRFNLEMLTDAALRPARYGTNLTRIAAPAFYIDSKA